MWGALSDERTGLSFTITAGPRHRSHSRISTHCIAPGTDHTENTASIIVCSR
jgi:hypothetical protein